MKRKLFIISLLFVFVLTGITAKNSPPKYLFKIASEAPDGSIWIESIKKINRELYKKTKGQVGIRVYPGSVMGDQNSIIKKIKLGQLSGATFSSGGLGMIYKDFTIMGFPMVFKNYQEYDYVRKKMATFFEKEFEKRGYVLLGWSEVGLIYVFSKNKVASLNALRKSKPFLVKGDRISIEFFKEINATPVPIPMSDVMTGLQTGTVDTVFSSTSGLVLMQWHSKVKYMADFPITLMIGAIMVDKDLFYSMPSEYQREMRSMFKTTFENLNTKIRNENIQALSLLKKNGLVVLPVDNKEKKIFTGVCNDVALRLTKKEFSRSLYNKITGYVEEYRKSH